MKHILDIKSAGRMYIYSSSEAHSEEHVIDFRRLWDWLRFFKFRVRGFKIVERDGGEIPEFERGYHASGHASAGELLRIVEEIEPEIVVLVHSENPEFFHEKLKGYKVVLAEDGKRVEIK